MKRVEVAISNSTERSGRKSSKYFQIGNQCVPNITSCGIISEAGKTTFVYFGIVKFASF